MNIGKYSFNTPLILAPMAGVSDLPFRNLCHQYGADLCVSEMVTSEIHLLNSRKSRLRLDHTDELGIRIIQIAGANPAKLADTARFNVSRGAEIIDINMGCPAKKVCHAKAGSALLKNEKLVADIITAVVNAVNVPITLKIRTGWDHQNKNAARIAGIAEENGIQAITIHGRTRADAYNGEAEYETIAEVKASVVIPVIANGDITTPEKAANVLHTTGADGIMIGRAALGNPWIFTNIRNYLNNRTLLPEPDNSEVSSAITEHLQNLYNFYGELSGVRIARKHIGWYIKNMQGASTFRLHINKIEDPRTQLKLVNDFINSQQILAA